MYIPSTCNPLHQLKSVSGSRPITTYPYIGNQELKLQRTAGGYFGTKYSYILHTLDVTLPRQALEHLLCSTCHS